MTFTEGSPLVLSSTSLGAFMRCPKSYELSYKRALDTPRTISDAVDTGRKFHKYMENAAKGIEIPADDMSDEATLAREYLKRRPFKGKTIGVEAQVWRRLLPNVLLRCTFDRMYVTDDNWCVIRDYKTFSREPSIDIDLDFQGRLYLAQLMTDPEQVQKYKGFVFEYENVRTVPPGTKNSKGFWSEAQCYINIPLIVSQEEAQTIWREAQEAAYYLLNFYERDHWYRVGLKSGPYSCNSCFVRELCKAELQLGQLDDQTISLLSVPREPLQVPEGV